MNIEKQSLHRRVARHAALADPVRLRIVDELALGDVAPVELQHELEISSSLLSHHLKQLESAGLIERWRSEADRRRVYLHLAPDTLEGLMPSPVRAIARVVFVCTGNSARSQLAAAIWHESSTVPVASAGTRPAAAVEPGAFAAAERHKITLDARIPRALPDVLQPDDFVVTVCDSAHEELGPSGGLHWSVPDPVRDGSAAGFDAAFENLAGRIQALAPRVVSP